MSEQNATYHEIDFLLPAQRFNIQFSYVSQKGLSFIREFILRLVQLAPMTKLQISTYFGLTKREADEAITDLIERDELTLSLSGKLILTKKSNDYFSKMGASPKLSTVEERGASLTFEMATFSCIGKGIIDETWKAGLPLKVENEQVSQSESLVEKSFQIQFHEILDKNYLPGLNDSGGSEKPTIYTVNSVDKMRELPMRLTSEFKVDREGRAVERDDFENLRNSGPVHELITYELSRMSKHSNIKEIAESMVLLEDKETSKLFNSNSIDLKLFELAKSKEEHYGSDRASFLGPIYMGENWELLQRRLAPILVKRIEDKSEDGQGAFIWIGPSDPYWGKSQSFFSAMSSFLSRAETKKKRLYRPTIYLPVIDQSDYRGANQWEYELGKYKEHARGLVEGFLGGNVEVVCLAGELVSVIYHVSHPESLPVSLPVGFISTDKKIVDRVSQYVNDYIEGGSAFDKPNDCGRLSEIRR